MGQTTNTSDLGTYCNPAGGFMLHAVRKNPGPSLPRPPGRACLAVRETQRGFLLDAFALHCVALRDVALPCR